MVSIKLENIAKVFNRQVIFKNVTFQFEEGKKYAIHGSNGSGKSTLLQIISGFLSADKGFCTYHTMEGHLKTEEVSKHIAICSPSAEFFPDMSLKEALDFHFHFKSLLHFTNLSELLLYLGFKPSQSHEKLRNFSSGMLQKLKLGVALFSNTPILLLDEPCMNLDEQNRTWYKHNIPNFTQNRLVIIASNDTFETSFCEKSLNIMDFKQ